MSTCRPHCMCYVHRSSGKADGTDGQDVETATAAQCQDIRVWLKLGGKRETETTQFYCVPRPEDLPSAKAHEIISRWMRLGRGPLTSNYVVEVGG